MSPCRSRAPDRDAEGRPRRMLEQIRPVKAVLERTQFLPPVLALLMSARAIGDGIENVVVAIKHDGVGSNLISKSRIRLRIYHEYVFLLCNTLRFVMVGSYYPS